MQQGYPSAMVKAAVRIKACRDTLLPQSVLNPHSQLWRAGGRILKSIQGTRKASKVMHGFRTLRGRNFNALRHPVGRNHDDGAGLTKLATKFRELSARKARVERVGRCAV